MFKERSIEMTKGRRTRQKGIFIAVQLLIIFYSQDKGIQKDKSGIYTCFEHMCSFMFQLHLDDVAQQVN